MAQLAVITTGGKQYIVKAGDTLRVEKLEAADGAKLTFEPMLVMEEDGTGAKVGAPAVKGASVAATVVKTGKGDKIYIIKYHAKTRYKRKNGHRQPFTEITIDSVKA
jgi:large subunit ribosomal protein L21